MSLLCRINLMVNVKDPERVIADMVAIPKGEVQGGVAAYSRRSQHNLGQPPKKVTAVLSSEE